MVKEVVFVAETRKILANNIIYFRLKNKWSQEHFAELLGTSPSYVSEIENCKRNISIDYIDHISNIFKVEPHELFIKRLTVDKRRVPKRRR